MAITKRDDRERLQKFAYSTIDAAEFELLYQAVYMKCKCIAELMKYCAYRTESDIACHAALHLFFKSCTKQIFPAIHFLPKCVWKDIELLLETRSLDVSIMESVVANSPALAGFFAYQHTITTSEQRENVKTL